MNEETRRIHPAQIQVSLSRITCNKSIPFYGSDIECNSWIQLEIAESEHERSLSNDSYFAHKKHITLRMSANQFSELITSMNMGGGVCATLQYKDGLKIEEYKPINKIDTFNGEIDLRGNKIIDKCNAFSEALDKVKISVKDKEFLSGFVYSLKQEIKSNIPFVIRQAKEQFDKVVVSAKQTIESYYTGLVTKLGVKALQDVSVKLIEDNHE